VVTKGIVARAKVRAIAVIAVNAVPTAPDTVANPASIRLTAIPIPATPNSETANNPISAKAKPEPIPLIVPSASLAKAPIAPQIPAIPIAPNNSLRIIPPLRNKEELEDAASAAELAALVTVNAPITASLIAPRTPPNPNINLWK
jgi:hypothetical protein